VKCADVQSDLCRYSVGLMSKWRVILTRLHIARCRTCSRELELLLDADRSLTAALQEPVPSPDISRRVMPLLTTPPQMLAERNQWRFAVGVAAVALALLAFAVTVQQPREERNVATAPRKPSVERIPVPQEIIVAPQEPEQPKMRMVEKPNVPRARPAKRATSSVRGYAKSRPAAPEPAQDGPRCALESTEPVTAELDSQIIIVVVSEPPQKMTIEVQSTNQETGEVSYYKESRDENGQVQMARLTYTPINFDMEGS
jgi:type IV secretory pathway VirB10-like protein